MSTHHLSRRPRGAVAGAVAGLVWGACDGAAACASPKSTAPATRSNPAAESTCYAWVAATRRANDKVGENKTHEVTISALAQACSAIPARLRRAAGEVER